MSWKSAFLAKRLVGLPIDLCHAKRDVGPAMSQRGMIVVAPKIGPQDVSSLCHHMVNPILN